MAAPTQPTATSIVTEAYRKYGISSPGTAVVNTAISEGIEKVKRDMWALSQRWKPLIKFGYDMTVKGISKYPYPADYEFLKSIAVWEGTATGTFQGGAVGTSTLAATEAITQDSAEGALLAITSGQGVDQAVQIDDYNTTTKVAIHAESLTTAPNASSTYLVAVQQYMLGKEDSLGLRGKSSPTLNGRPHTYYPLDDIYSGKYELELVPDKVYLLRMEYYANLLLIDVADTPGLYNKLLYNWAGVWTQGVYTWILDQYEDARYHAQEQIYTAMLRRLAAKDSDYHNQSQLQARSRSRR